MKKIISLLSILMLLVVVSGCSNESAPPKKPKIGVSLGVGGASRWSKEAAFMEARAKELGADIEMRLNKTDKPKTQKQDCIEMIDSGINVLIITPRDVNNISDIVDYAHSKNVKVISYARAVLKDKVDLIIGYDVYKIGQSLGLFLSERIYKGDFIILKGDESDYNTALLYNGSNKYIAPMVGSGVNIILNDYVPKWSTNTAKEMVKAAVIKNNYKIDAILCPNDGLASGAAAAIEELGIKNHVVITGMDAEISALKRLVAGTQDVTVYMELKILADATIDRAYDMALGKKINVNAEFDNGNKQKIDAYLISGQLVTKENLNKYIIEPGHFTKEEIYGE